MTRVIFDSTNIKKYEENSDVYIDYPNIFDMDYNLQNNFKLVHKITVKRVTLPIVWHTIQRQVNNYISYACAEWDTNGDYITTHGSTYDLPEGWWKYKDLKNIDVECKKIESNNKER